MDNCRSIFQTLIRSALVAALVVGGAACVDGLGETSPGEATGTDRQAVVGACDVNPDPAHLVRTGTYEAAVVGDEAITIFPVSEDVDADHFQWAVDCIGEEGTLTVSAFNRETNVVQAVELGAADIGDAGGPAIEIRQSLTIEGQECPTVDPERPCYSNLTGATLNAERGDDTKVRLVLRRLVLDRVGGLAIRTKGCVGLDAQDVHIYDTVPGPGSGAGFVGRWCVVAHGFLAHRFDRFVCDDTGDPPTGETGPHPVFYGVGVAVGPSGNFACDPEPITITHSEIRVPPVPEPFRRPCDEADDACKHHGPSAGLLLWWEGDVEIRDSTIEGDIGVVIDHTSFDLRNLDITATVQGLWLSGDGVARAEELDVSMMPSAPYVDPLTGDILPNAAVILGQERPHDIAPGAPFGSNITLHESRFSGSADYWLLARAGTDSAFTDNNSRSLSSPGNPVRCGGETYDGSSPLACLERGAYRNVLSDNSGVVIVDVPFDDSVTVLDLDGKEVIDDTTGEVALAVPEGGCGSAGYLDDGQAARFANMRPTVVVDPYSGLMDLEALIEPGVDNNRVVTYAWTEVMVPGDMSVPVQLQVDSDDALQVLLRDPEGVQREVLWVPSARGVGLRGTIQDTCPGADPFVTCTPPDAPIELYPGRNLFTFKTFEWFGDWSFRARLLDPEGNLLLDANGDPVSWLGPTGFFREYRLLDGTIGVSGVGVGSPDNEGSYDAYITTHPINISGLAPGERLFLRFDSSWRDEDTQTANIVAHFDGAGSSQCPDDEPDGEGTELLRWESEELLPDGSPNPNFHNDAPDEDVSIEIFPPDGASEMELTFGLFNARNDWWWALDNIEVVKQNADGTEVSLFAENFEGLTLGPSVDEEIQADGVWTDQPPDGWTSDFCDSPAGIREWDGWAFADVEWWAATAYNQRRSFFANGGGSDDCEPDADTCTVMVADPDEWDDISRFGPAARLRTDWLDDVPRGNTTETTIDPYAVDTVGGGSGRIRIVDQRAGEIVVETGPRCDRLVVKNDISAD